MAMTGEGLKALRKQYVDAVEASQSSDAATCIAYSDAILLADSKAIVDYIQQNACAVGSDSDGDSHELNIE